MSTLFTTLATGLATSLIFDFTKSVADSISRKETVQLILRKLGTGKSLSDFPERYVETLIEFRLADKTESILEFFRDKSIMSLLYDYYYAPEDSGLRKNERKLYVGMEHFMRSLTVGENITKENINFDAEIKLFLDIFKQKIHESRSISASELYSLIRDIQNQTNSNGELLEEGVQPTDDFWEEWTSGPKFNLIPDILLGGRKKEQKELIDSVDKSTVLPIQSLSREESIAFVVASFKSSDDKQEDFFSRSLIVDNPHIFRKLAVHSKPLILIPRFDDNGVINRAVQNGHKVIVPLGADSANNWSNKILLPQIDRESFIAALTKTGISKEFAERYSRETARNITILRRQLGFIRTIPDWAKSENVADMIPALLVGRWDENFESDKMIIAKIAGVSYEAYSKSLNKWLYTDDSPVIKIGSTWRLASPFDAWTNASKHLTQNDFNVLQESVNEILSEVNPAFELEPEQRYMSLFHGKQREYSSWLREGIIQSLILTSIFGDKLNFNLPISAELWVDGMITKILSSQNSEMWKSFEGELPLIAEASPNSFLDSIEKHLKNSHSPIHSLFEEDPGFLSNQSYHTGLLWALESLAWFPEYLSRAALCLAKLAAIDPGGNLANRPINSLTEIFKTWHYQTQSSLNERMEVLNLISEKEPEIGWTMLIRMLPGPMRDIAQPTSQTRWRMIDQETTKSYTWQEINKTHSTVIGMLIETFDLTETKLVMLIDESVNLTPEVREKLLTFIEKRCKDVNHIEHECWHAARKILYDHRSNSDTDWALPKWEIKRYQRLYDVLKPKNGIDQIIWMFDEHWPNFPDGYKFKGGNYEEQEKIIFQRRIDGLRSIYKEYGIDKIIGLVKTVQEPWIFGNTLGSIVKSEVETIKLCEFLKGNEDQRFIQGYLIQISDIKGLDWAFEFYNKLKELKFNNASIAMFLVPLNQSQKLWDFLESCDEAVVKEYWKNIYPHFHRISSKEKIFGIKKLIEHKRFVAVIVICAQYSKEIPSDLIVASLEKAGTEKTDEQVRLDPYKINRLFGAIDERDDVELNTFLKLEWLYFTALNSYRKNLKPKRIHEELARNPEFFMEVLKWIYLPGDKTKIEGLTKGMTDEQLKDRAEQAYKVLHSWENIPGVDDDYKIDYHFLTNWVKKARALAKEYGRIDAAEIYIGRVLAHYPEKADQIWPPNEICKIIEDVNSDSLNRNFSMETFNKRGSSSRGPFEGGNIERSKAEYFSKNAEAHRNKFPSVARIFEKLAKRYEEDAKKMDDEADRRKLEN